MFWVSCWSYFLVMHYILANCCRFLEFIDQATGLLLAAILALQPTSLHLSSFSDIGVMQRCRNRPVINFLSPAYPASTFYQHVFKGKGILPQI